MYLCRIVKWIGWVCLAGSLQAQSPDAASVLDRIEARQNTYVKYDSFSARIRTMVRDMDASWSSKKTEKIDKSVAVNGQERVEDILKAVRIEKGVETDVTEEYRKKESEARSKRQKENLKSVAAEKDSGKDSEKHSISMDLGQLFPFAKDKRKEYLFSFWPDTVLADRPVITVRVEAKEKSSERFNGRYWFDKETFDAVAFSVRPSKNPTFVKDMRMDMGFDVLDGKYLVPRTTFFQVYVNAIIKKFRMEVEEIYGDFTVR